MSKLYSTLLGAFEDGFLLSSFQVFFQEIFLGILEASSSSFQHKWLVMQALSRICSGTEGTLLSISKLYFTHNCILSYAEINCNASICHDAHLSSGIPKGDAGYKCPCYSGRGSEVSLFNKEQFTFMRLNVIQQKSKRLLM